jgi:hypothetical protein
LPEKVVGEGEAPTGLVGCVIGFGKDEDVMVVGGSEVVDKPCTKEHVEIARGLLKSVEAAFEMTYFGRAISEAEELADVHVLLDWGV